MDLEGEKDDDDGKVNGSSGGVSGFAATRQQEKKRFDEARPLIQFLLQVNTFEYVKIKLKR